ncbi:MAG: HK97 family phage prohead protease [Alphaproteobacteria bacterium]|nr:HK97 family phage prohead protease [Alphaproteobacteria bacterium]
MTEPGSQRVLAPLEIKRLGPQGHFSGYAAIFGTADSQNDIISPGAFTRTLREHREAGTLPALLWMHDTSRPLGQWDVLREDGQGLYVEGRLAIGTRAADEAWQLMRSGALTGLSIGYRTRRARFDTKTGTRMLLDIALSEISLVALPAHEGARITAFKSAGAEPLAEGLVEFIHARETELRRRKRH